MEPALALGLAAAAALAVWLAVLAVLALATRPDLPDPAPATPEFGGDETPAVVNFLTNRWELGHEAVPATLLDLAARGAVSIDQVAPDRFVCRLRSGTPAALTDYERQVLDHVRRLAHDGVVPCEALTTGPEEASKGWWERFRKNVVADARRQGLSRSRWSKPALTALGVTAIAPAILAAAAFVAAPVEEGGEEEDPIGAFVGMTAFAWTGLMAIPVALRAERHTATGRDVAARWLGLHRWLDEDEAFDRAPPAAVAIWDRYLAYGAAMGVAAGAVRALPLGSESATEAWSAYGGHWHVVHVRYPQRVPPGYGQRPIVAAAKGLATCALAFFLATRIAPPVADVATDVWDTARRDGWETWALIGTAVAAAVLAAISLFVLRSAIMLALAAADLVSRVEVEGLVIRLRSGYLAVDDGERRTVRAWRVEPQKLAGVSRGQVVRVTASRYLGYVSAITPVGAEPGHAGLANAPVDTVEAVPSPDLDLDDIAARTGVRLRFRDGQGTAVAIPGTERAVVLSDGHDGTVLAISASGSTAATGVLGWITRHGATPIGGVAGATEAVWNDGRSVLTAERGDRRVTVMVNLRSLSPDERVAVAQAVAEQLLWRAVG